MTDDTTGRARRRLQAVAGMDGGRAPPGGASAMAYCSNEASFATDRAIASDRPTEGDLAIQFARGQRDVAAAAKRRIEVENTATTGGTVLVRAVPVDHANETRSGPVRVDPGCQVEQGRHNNALGGSS
jgi:hypothetical protein